MAVRCFGGRELEEMVFALCPDVVLGFLVNNDCLVWPFCVKSGGFCFVCPSSRTSVARNTLHILPPTAALTPPTLLHAAVLPPPTHSLVSPPSLLVRTQDGKLAGRGAYSYSEGNATGGSAEAVNFKKAGGNI